MPVGFQVYAETTGRLMIDSDSSLMIMVKKQTFTNMPVGTFDFVVNNIVGPIIAYSSNQYLRAPRLQSISGSNLTYRFSVEVANTTVTVYAFDLTRVITPSTYGVQTFDAAGNLLYDAVAGKYLRPVSYTAVGYPYTADQVLATIPAGRTYAAAMAIQSDYLNMNMGLSQSIYPTSKISGSSVLASSHTYFLGAGASFVWNVPGSWLVIDVTNY